VERHALAARRDPSRERISEAQPVGKCPKSVQSDVADHLLPARCHNEAPIALQVVSMPAMSSRAIVPTTWDGSSLWP